MSHRKLMGWVTAAALGLGALGLSRPLYAQTVEQLHEQNFDAKTAQVHAKPEAPKAELSFMERYAPPKVISSYGDKIDWLFRYTSWGGFVFFVIMACALIYFLIAYRERPGHKAYYTHGTTKANGIVTRFLDLAVFVSLDLVLLYNSFAATTKYVWRYPDGPNVVKVEVMPQQWVWNFKYAGEDGKFGTPDDIYTVNEMRIPKGQPVLIQMISKDVIHGFMIPNVRMQIDAIPGQINKFWFDANQTGDFEIACYHLCGTAHYKMKAFLKVMEPADYEAWIKERSAWAAAMNDTEDQSTHWGWNWGI